MKKGFCINIDYKTAKDFLLPKHYSGRMPSISYAYGLYVDNLLVAVCTFGKPASPSLCNGICGKEYSTKVYELNRLCRTEEYKEQLSWFVSRCLKELKKRNLIIVSYSDTEMNHNGYIYQACNFIYLGKTKARTDKYTEGNKHSRHYDNNIQNGSRKYRSAKHRYLYICGDKNFKKEALRNLKYKIESYPKGINKNYVLGDYLKPKVL
jgi:hypothetical protein